MSQLWTAEALIEATDGRPLGQMPGGIGGISIDTRTLKPGDAFFAIKGDTLDGHDFATAAMAAGAGVLVVAERQAAGARPRSTAPMIVVPDVLEALEKAGIAARAALHGEDHRGHRLGRQDQHQGSAAPCAVERRQGACVGQVVQQPLGRAADAGAHARGRDYAIFEIGMNHAGEIRPLVKMVRPHVAIVTLIAAAHLGHFRNLDEIATRQGGDLRGHRAGRRRRSSTATIRAGSCSTGWRARPASSTSSASARHARANFKLIECELEADQFGDRRQDRRPRSRRRASARPAGMSSRTRWPCSARPSWSAPTSTRWRRRSPR